MQGQNSSYSNPARSTASYPPASSNSSQNSEEVEETSRAVTIRRRIEDLYEEISFLRTHMYEIDVNASPAILADISATTASLANLRVSSNLGFPLFPTLPTELRLQIWQCALLRPRVIPIRTGLSGGPHPIPDGERGYNRFYDDNTVHGVRFGHQYQTDVQPTRPPKYRHFPLLFVNKEARGEMLKNLTSDDWRAFAPVRARLDTDIFWCLRSGSLLRQVLSLSNYTTNEVEKGPRRVAVSWEEMKQGLESPSFTMNSLQGTMEMMYKYGLREIYVLIGNERNEFDCFGVDVSLRTSCGRVERFSEGLDGRLGSWLESLPRRELGNTWEALGRRVEEVIREAKEDSWEVPRVRFAEVVVTTKE